MKLKTVLKFLLLFTFVLLLNTTFAETSVNDSSRSSENTAQTTVQADSASGNGISIYTTFLILAVIAIAAIFGTIPLLTKLKSHFAAKVMTHASNKDTFWNAAELKKHAERTFYEIQDAWENRNMAKVKDKVDENLYSEYTTLLAPMIARHEKNILSQIQIDEIRIIGCEDHIDNSKDRYIAYIQGRLLNYVINEDTQEIIKNPSKTLSNFSDSYHFVRNNNNWILEIIDKTVTIQDIIQSKNSIEG